MDSFEKIIGYKKEKEELRRTADMLKNRAKYTALGIEIPNALLLYGVPGVGKTIMAKAMIEESGLKCFDCRKDSPDGEFVKKIRDTFVKAEENAPSIVLLDDMDKFAEDNLEMNCNKEEFSVIQSCIESTRKSEVFVLATANDIDNLPSSLMRSGRFGRKIEVKVPSVEDTALIIERYLNGITCESGINADTIALILAGKSCAAVESIINEARILAAYDNSGIVKKKHLIHSIMRMTENLIETPVYDDKQIRRTAYHEAGHAIVEYFNGYNIALISILGYGDVGGCCITSDNITPYSFQIIRNRVCTMMAGKAAVKLVFNEEDMGAGKDIEIAMKSIRGAIEKFCADGFEYGYCLDKWSCQQALSRMDRVADRAYIIAKECYERAYEILSQNILLLHKIADHLIEYGFILKSEFQDILKEHSK